MNNLRELRKSKRLMQKDMAETFGVAKSTYSCWENGKNDPDFATAVRLADFFGVPVDYIIGKGEEKEVAADDSFNVEGFQAFLYSKGLDYDQVATFMSLIKNLTKKQMIGLMDLLTSI